MIKVNHRVGLYDPPLKSFVAPKQKLANKKAYLRNKAKAAVNRKKWWKLVSPQDKQFYSQRSKYLSLLRTGKPLPKADYLGVVRDVAAKRKEALSKLQAPVTTQQRRSVAQTHAKMRQELLAKLRSTHMSKHPSRWSKAQTSKFEQHLAKVGTKKISFKARMDAAKAAMAT